MSYDETFYEKYQEYLEEYSVRTQHDRMLDLFHMLVDTDGFPRNVIDLGCGSGEYQKYNTAPENYLGIDLEPRCKNSIIGNYNEGAYELLKNVQKTYGGWTPTMFVSLFSTECCLNADQKYKLYNDLFDFCGPSKTMMAGCVSGFYYLGKENEEMIEETGGLISYQSIESQHKYWNPHFMEVRICIEVPSRLFGSNVVEVWKFFIRNALPNVSRF